MPSHTARAATGRYGRGPARPFRPTAVTARRGGDALCAV